MCSNYRPVTRLDRLLTFFGVERSEGEPPLADEVFPLGLAPFIRLHEEGSGNRVIEAGVFGFLPHFATELAFGRRTYNARSETVSSLPTFKRAWAEGQRCVVPAEAVFEPSWVDDDGVIQPRAVRWRVQRPGAVPFGIAGVYRRWRSPAGERMSSFAMLTVNATSHPVYARFHRPGDEKRMVAVLNPADYEAWLTCGVKDAGQFLRPWTGALDASPDPLVRPGRPPPRAEPDLFQ